MATIIGPEPPKERISQLNGLGEGKAEALKSLGEKAPSRVYSKSTTVDWSEFTSVVA